MTNDTALCRQCGGPMRARGKGCKRCYDRDRMRDRRRDDPSRVLWDAAKHRASVQGEPFRITLADVRAAWPPDGHCPALGIPLRAGRGTQHDGSPTLDRVQGTWGYEPGNVAVISLKANRAKGGLTAQELDRIAAWMRRSGAG